MNFAQMLNERKIKMRKENINLLRKNINSKNVLKKINNHIIRFGNIFTIRDIQNQILSNDLVASCFCVEPGRQNIAETYGLELLKLEKLPQKDENCIRFSITGDIVHEESGNSEPADTIYNGMYTTMKYTEEAGGAQNNQKAKVIDFLRNGSKKHKVCAIVDGDYWIKHREELKKLFKDNPNVVITSIDEILGLSEE